MLNIISLQGNANQNHLSYQYSLNSVRHKLLISGVGAGISDKEQFQNSTVERCSDFT